MVKGDLWISEGALSHQARLEAFTITDENSYSILGRKLAKLYLDVEHK
jgi:hypothetical protein